LASNSPWLIRPRSFIPHSCGSGAVVLDDASMAGSCVGASSRKRSIRPRTNVGQSEPSGVVVPIGPVREVAPDLPSSIAGSPLDPVRNSGRLRITSLGEAAVLHDVWPHETGPSALKAATAVVAGDTIGGPNTCVHCGETRSSRSGPRSKAVTNVNHLPR